MKRVLLNVTAREMRSISGDISYFRNLLHLKVPGVEFEFVKTLSVPGLCLREMRKGVERVMAARWPRAVNQRLFPMARFSFLPADAWAGADAILSHITFPLAFSRGRKPPIIWSTQGISPASYYDYHRRARFEDVVSVSRYFARRASRLLVWTHSGAEMMRRHCGLSMPIHVVPPVVPVPVPAAIALPREAEAHLLFIGRDPKRKGLAEAMQAFCRLGEVGRRFQFDIVTCVSREFRESFRDRPNIRFHENLSDEEVNQFFDRADIFIFPTHAETYGFVLIEAMARGCAIITCDYAPLNELVEHGRNGILVPPGDVHAIARALEMLASDARLVGRFQDENRQKYWKTFSPEPAAAELGKALSV